MFEASEKSGDALDVRLQIPVADDIDVLNLGKLVHISGSAFHELRVEVLGHYFNAKHF